MLARVVNVVWKEIIQLARDRLMTAFLFLLPILQLGLLAQATGGQISNLEHENISYGKAGKTRWLGRRPHVRGVVMNPVDHPHGGGEGRTSGGRHPVTPWGVPTKGYKTRGKKPSDRYILRRRNQKL